MLSALSEGPAGELRVEREIDAAVVHFGDEAMRSIFEVAQVGRVELLGTVCAVNGPDHAAALIVDTEVDVGELAPVGGGFVAETLRSRGGAVFDIPGGLVV